MKNLLFLASLVASVASHATFQEIWINGVDYGNTCVRLPQNNNPVQSVTSTDIACNAGASASKGLCPVNPGDTITVEMHQQPNDRSCSNEAIGGAHYGPIIMYMAQVTDALSAVGSSASWFKVAEMGLLSSSPDYFGTQVLNDNCGHFTFKIPTGISPGNYLLRAEVIALHVASSVGGAQFYMSCYQLQVGGSGTTKPPTVNIPGAYGASDPGILINIYTQLNSYVIPGPSPYGTTSPAVAATAWPTTATWNTAQQPSSVPTVMPGGGGTTTGGSSGPSTTTTTTSKTTTTTTPSGPTTTPGGGTTGGAHYSQCGGIGWTGATSCVSPYTCTVVNDYYYQCL